MALRDGFQPCTTDTGVSAPMPPWERNIVMTSLAVHMVDVGLDLLVVLLFFQSGQWGFFLASTAVILWSWVISSLYIAFGGANQSSGDIDDGPDDHMPPFLQSFVQVQIFTEAFRCIVHGGDTDYFYTLRLMEAVLESAPSSLCKLYALITWAGCPDAPLFVDTLLRISIMASVLSVGIGLAMWEQKVQFRSSWTYITSVSLFRAFEIASRSLTLAIFAGLTHPYGLWWALLGDYVLMLILIMKHQSVDLRYGFCVAVPLVLVSLEPLVWRREDHAVPKDSYYMVRIMEAVFMWIIIFHLQEVVDGADSDLYLGAEALALLATLGLYTTLPFVWCTARRNEQPRDVTDWVEDEEMHHGLADDRLSDSDYSSDDSDRGAGALMPGE